jgi:hypothetical protein
MFTIIYFAIIFFGIMPSIHLLNVVLKLLGGVSSKGFNHFFGIEFFIESKCSRTTGDWTENSMVVLFV